MANDIQNFMSFHLGKAYVSQQQFLDDLNNNEIPLNKLTNYIKEINAIPARWFFNSFIYDSIVSHLDKRTNSGTLMGRQANQVDSLAARVLPNNNNNNSLINSNTPIEKKEYSIALHCETGDQSPVIFSDEIKEILVSSSPVLQKMISADLMENKQIQITVPSNITRNTLLYLQKYLEKGEIEDFKGSALTMKRPTELLELALEWEMTGLVNYLSPRITFESKDDFIRFFQGAVKTRSLQLFKKCLSKFDHPDYLISVKNFDNIVVCISTELSENGEQKLGEMCQFLKDNFQKIKNFEVIYSNNFKTITEFPQVQSLNELLTAFYINDINFSYDALALFLKKCQNLESIKFRLPISQIEKLNALIETSKPFWPHFQSLYLILDDKNISLQSLIRYPMLTQLIGALDIHIPITDVFLRNLIQACPNLTTLNLSNRATEKMTPKQVFTVLGETCPQLVSLNFETFSQLKDEDLEILLQKCKKIKILNCNSYSSVLTGRSLDTIRNNCPDITELSLSNIGYISDTQFTEFQKKYSKQLTSMNLQLMLSDGGFEQFLEYCPQLQELTLTGDDNSDKTLDILPEKFPNLTYFKLNLYNFQTIKFTPKGIIRLKHRLPGCTIKLG